MSSRKIILPTHGDYGVFKIPTIVETGPKNGEVQVEVKFSGINFADLLMRQGLYPGAPKFPFTPGYEFSGVVKSIGEGVENFSLGDEVYGGSYFGAYSGLINIPQKQIRRVPNGISLEEAAAIPVSFLTAYITLFDLARVKTGDKILIDCMTGSLGHWCHTLLKNNNCEIVGLTSSPQKIDFIEKMGAKGMTHQDFYNNKTINNFDFILNSQGGKTIKEHYQRLAPTGRMVMVGASSAVNEGKRSLLKAIKMLLGMPTFKPVNLMNDNKGVMGLNVLNLFEDPEFLFKRLDQLEFFDLDINVDKVFPAEEVGKAHQYIESKKSKGKVLLSW